MAWSINRRNITASNVNTTKASECITYYMDDVREKEEKM